jgi:hypothetical protein
MRVLIIAKFYEGVKTEWVDAKNIDFLLDAVSLQIKF